MKKHRCLFKVKSVEIIERSEKEALEQMFGKMPPLPKGKRWCKVKEMVTIHECSCGRQMKFIDTPQGDWNSSLPDEFTVAPPEKEEVG